MNKTKLDGEDIKELPKLPKLPSRLASFAVASEGIAQSAPGEAQAIVDIAVPESELLKHHPLGSCSCSHGGTKSMWTPTPG